MQSRKFYENLIFNVVFKLPNLSNNTYTIGILLVVQRLQYIAKGNFLKSMFSLIFIFTKLYSFF